MGPREDGVGFLLVNSGPAWASELVQRGGRVQSASYPTHIWDGFEMRCSQSKMLDRGWLGVNFLTSCLLGHDAHYHAR